MLSGFARRRIGAPHMIEKLALWLRHASFAAMQEQSALIEKPILRTRQPHRGHAGRLAQLAHFEGRSSRDCRKSIGRTFPRLSEHLHLTQQRGGRRIPEESVEDHAVEACRPREKLFAVCGKDDFQIVAEQTTGSVRGESPALSH